MEPGSDKSLLSEIMASFPNVEISASSGMGTGLKGVVFLSAVVDLTCSMVRLLYQYFEV